MAPATLTVVLSPSLQHHEVLQVVPQLDWARAPGNFCEFTYTSSPIYYGPHIELQRLVLRTVNSGVVQPLRPAYTNSSYELSFHGPSLQCDPYPMEISPGPLNSILNTSSTWFDIGKNSVIYFATAPMGNGTANMTTLLPLLQNLAVVPTSNSTTKYSSSGYTGGEGIYYTGLDKLSTDAARLWVFFNPTYYPTSNGLNRRMLDKENYTDGSAAMQCTLYNSSYTVNFNFSSGTQLITLRNETKLNAVAYVDKMLKDTMDYEPIPEVYPTMNYQAVMHAVGKLVMGWLEGTWLNGDGVTGPSFVTFTSIVNTKQFDDYRLDNGFTNNSDSADTTRNQSIARAFEDTMRNVTFSLFTSSRFL